MGKGKVSSKRPKKPKLELPDFSDLEGMSPEEIAERVLAAPRQEKWDYIEEHEAKVRAWKDGRAKKPSQ